MKPGNRTWRVNGANSSRTHILVDRRGCLRKEPLASKEVFLLQIA